MAIGQHKPEQQTMWLNQHQLPKGQGHPFYSRLNDLLAKDGLDSWAEGLCAPSFAGKGRPSIPPGVSFRMLFIGDLEGFASDRGPLPGTARIGSPCARFWVLRCTSQRLARKNSDTSYLDYVKKLMRDAGVEPVKIHAGDCGGTSSMETTLAAANENLASLGDEAPEPLCAVADKG